MKKIGIKQIKQAPIFWLLRKIWGLIKGEEINWFVSFSSRRTLRMAEQTQNFKFIFWRNVENSWETISSSRKDSSINDVTNILSFFEILYTHCHPIRFWTYRLSMQNTLTLSRASLADVIYRLPSLRIKNNNISKII